MCIVCARVVRVYCAVALTRGGAAVRSRKPFLNFRVSVRRYLIRPVPCVFLRFAFTLQLSAHREQEHTDDTHKEHMNIPKQTYQPKTQRSHLAAFSDQSNKGAQKSQNLQNPETDSWNLKKRISGHEHTKPRVSKLQKAQTHKNTQRNSLVPGK